MENLFTAIFNRKSKEFKFPFLSSFNCEKVNYSLLANYKNQQKRISKLKTASFLYWVLTRPISVAVLVFMYFCYKNHIYLSYSEDYKFYQSALILAICVIVGYSFSLFFKKMRVKLVKGKDIPAEVELLKNYERNLISYVAEDNECYKCDLFCISKRMKRNGEAGFFNYSKNVEVFTFRRKDDLCILIEDNIFYIPISRIKNFYICTKTYTFTNWNKEDSFYSAKYKPYKIAFNSKVSQYYVKNTSHLVLEINGADYEIVFPPYETEFIEVLTGLKAKEK